MKTLKLSVILLFTLLLATSAHGRVRKTAPEAPVMGSSAMAMDNETFKADERVMKDAILTTNFDGNPANDQEIPFIDLGLKVVIPVRAGFDGVIGYLRDANHTPVHVEDWSKNDTLVTWFNAFWATNTRQFSPAGISRVRLFMDKRFRDRGVRGMIVPQTNASAIGGLAMPNVGAGWLENNVYLDRKTATMLHYKGATGSAFLGRQVSSMGTGVSNEFDFYDDVHQTWNWVTRGLWDSLGCNASSHWHETIHLLGSPDLSVDGDAWPPATDPREGPYGWADVPIQPRYGLCGSRGGGYSGLNPQHDLFQYTYSYPAHRGQDMVWNPKPTVKECSDTFLFTEYPRPMWTNLSGYGASLAYSDVGFHDEEPGRFVMLQRHLSFEQCVTFAMNYWCLSTAVDPDTYSRLQPASIQKADTLRGDAVSVSYSGDDNKTTVTFTKVVEDNIGHLIFPDSYKVVMDASYGSPLATVTVTDFDQDEYAVEFSGNLVSHTFTVVTVDATPGWSYEYAGEWWEYTDQPLPEWPFYGAEFNLPAERGYSADWIGR